MNKNFFIKTAREMSNYQNKLIALDNILNADVGNSFIGDIFKDLGDLLLDSLNVELLDCQYEDFWNYIIENAEEDQWSEFYDEVTKGE